MAIGLSKKFHRKKFMWDGITYEDGEKAGEAVEAYKKDGFEVEMLAEGDLYLVYTRRVSAAQSGN